DYACIDVIYDFDRTVQIKSFTERHSNKMTTKQTYELTELSELPSGYDYDQFISINRAAIAILIRNCWLKMVQQIPKNKIFIVAGPDTKTFQLTNNNVIESTDLACNQSEADTRMFVHVNHISHNSKYAQIVLKVTDIDIVVLAVGYANQFQNELIVNSSPSPTNQKFINCSKLSNECRTRHKIKPKLFILHALSGCDSTSFIRNVSKKKHLKHL
ncbi:unnamed protein product, partial [Didymodactylos carnosus]